MRFAVLAFGAAIVGAQVSMTQTEMSLETATTMVGYGEPLTRGRDGASRP
jgi:hypothetical protein